KTSPHQPVARVVHGLQGPVAPMIVCLRMPRLALPASLLFLYLLPAAAQAAPQRSVDMGGDWKYLPYDGEGNMALESIDDSGWPTMALPTNWYLMGSKSYPVRARATARLMDPGSPADLPAPPRDMGFDYEGTVWFRKSITWEGSGTALLDLDMVDYYA